MPRPKRRRKINMPPHFRGFMPIGLQEESNPIILDYEEYESIRLCDFELFGQFEASQIMEISRPTFSRIYESARRKVAAAFINGRPIIFEGGKVYFDSEWFSCNNCGCFFNNTNKDCKVESCSLCGSENIEQYNDNTETNTKEDFCYCTNCGIQINIDKGTPCNSRLCPECNCHMIRNGYPNNNRMRKHNRNK
jgi:predicted DNA-binding protein (UPF0251 family)